LRWLALLAGTTLVALAFAAVTRVSDTREGLVAEIITLLAGAAGVLLLVYGLAARRRYGPSLARVPPVPSQPVPRPRSRNDLVLGVGGIVVTAFLLGGLAFSGGFLWALLGSALLLPMAAGSVYLCVRFLRASP